MCGAAGGIGQPLSLLLKQSDLVTDLSLYDVVNAAGVAADLSHINTKSTVRGHGRDDIDAALAGAHTVVIPAGVPRKPGMTRDDLFKVRSNVISKHKPISERWNIDRSLRLKCRSLFLRRIALDQRRNCPRLG